MIRIHSWNRKEGPSMLGSTSIQTEFNITTKDSIGDSQSFLDYITEYDASMTAGEWRAAKEIFRSSKKDHEFWRAKNLERDEMIALLDKIFLDENGNPLDPKTVYPTYPITWDRITLLIETLLRDHGVFYKPEKRETLEKDDNTIPVYIQGESFTARQIVDALADDGIFHNAVKSGEGIPIVVVHPDREPSRATTIGWVTDVKLARNGEVIASYVPRKTEYANEAWQGAKTLFPRSFIGSDANLRVYQFAVSYNDYRTEADYERLEKKEETSEADAEA